MDARERKRVIYESFQVDYCGKIEISDQGQ